MSDVKWDVIQPLEVSQEAIEQSILLLQKAGWMQEHDRILTEVKWIPCTERLPEEDGLYLVTHSYKYGNTDIAVNRVKTMLFWEKSKSWQVDGITAWMPLPPPYKGE